MKPFRHGMLRGSSNTAGRLTMANLIISTVCNQTCAYCFTADHRNGNSPAPAFLDIHDFNARLDFLDRSGMEHARLLGGEPTLHPGFTELVESALARHKMIVVFSNGLMPDAALDCLASLPIAVCHVMINVNAPTGGATDTSFKRRRTALTRLGERAMLSFNIDRVNCQPEFLLPLIAETGCRPLIRLGMAQPCLSGSNAHIHPKQYRAVAQIVVRLARAASSAGVKLDMDCGFVRCMFSPEELETLTEAKADVGWRCNPILDIDTAGQVIHCFPLASFGALPLAENTTAQALRDAFTAAAQPFRLAGVYPECSNCGFKLNGECTGGCLAATMRRFRSTPFRLTVPCLEVTV